MFYGKIDKSRLRDFLEELDEMVAFHKWHDEIPLVVGYEPYLPISFKDAEQHAEIFRNNDQLLAYESAQYPELHNKMISIVKFIMDVNKCHEEWELFEEDGVEYPGASFVFALASEDKKYLQLCAEFLISIESKYGNIGCGEKRPIDFSFLYFGYDIIKLIKNGVGARKPIIYCLPTGFSMIRKKNPFWHIYPKPDFLLT